MIIICVTVTYGFMVVACWVYILVVLCMSTDSSEPFLETRGVKVIKELDSHQAYAFWFIWYLAPICFIH